MICSDRSLSAGGSRGEKASVGLEHLLLMEQGHHHPARTATCALALPIKTYRPDRQRLYSVCPV